MPKLKTKSGAKKRFKITATGKVKYAQAGKRHGMIKRTNKQIRELRGTSVLFKTDGDNIKKYSCPTADRFHAVHHSRARFAAIRHPFPLKEIRHVSRQTRRDLPRQAQENLQGRQGLLWPPQEHHPHRQGRRSRRPTQYAFRDRKRKKRTFRALWIQRLNAAVRPFGLTYSVFIDGLAKSGITVDRKVLSDLAIHEPAAFQAIVEKAKAALPA